MVFASPAPTNENRRSTAKEEVMNPTVTFTVIAGPRKGQTLEFDTPLVLSVGRSPDCLLCLADCGDPTVSRHHCIFDIAPPHVVVRDVGSRNGTYVNNIRLGGLDGHGKPAILTRLALYPGDVVRVGGTRFRVTTSEAFSVRSPVPEDHTEFLGAEDLGFTADEVSEGCEEVGV
jgi:pSer/pThr/pTyr-binding forkhead associated (FHA) protein